MKYFNTPTIIVLILIFCMFHCIEMDDDTSQNSTFTNNVSVNNYVDLNTHANTHSYDNANQRKYIINNNSTYRTRKKALTDEQADKLHGTGYNNTKPNSSAESIEIEAAKVKCVECGYHSDNGLNSICDECKEEMHLIKK